ncbi:outer membrane protein assembly factor BamB family protein [Burkholderia multivorans]|uniref:outer membrane protein assembly factor BamB family protein n=1 Tax=Burkholderia multivorans TaxID=87883 RepID=UPI000CFED7F2|nr:PQQ-binding-like beta-propeller repeat protein [Burkholderia multivorans]MBU9160131.1 PQQ-binding-like beta-propeller repeat protein [Burkholderia multivorans]MBU9261132.1 PQQ-binding-like beta-propeller repeat protein [Burkholderia multivorans]MBU9487024.1 PQQ-binding-like beta-propeller repeat protein [Burkholderia multivorans]MBU9541397.1 PQQ-binding-like beta-propeller repeat protein [Burkholderia multivorans]MCA8173533.1 PQQ-binding-like beta-propeller repeat protein [Burkholderia mult
MKKTLNRKGIRWHACRPGRRSAIAVAALLAGTVAAGTAALAQTATDWPMAGRSAHNTRSASDERAIGVDSVAKLAPRWSVDTDGNVSATPTVVDGVVYVPDFGGTLWAVDAASGQVKWRKKVSEYSGVPNDASRTSPAYWKGTLVIGQGTQVTNNPSGAYMLGIKAEDGSPLWRTQVEADPSAVITSSPVIDDGIVYVGVSSRAEALKDVPKYRGSVVALNAMTGKLLWKTYMVPVGYTGGSVWGNTPVVDRETGLVYVTTGNNFTVPPGVCRYPTQTKCKPGARDNYIDSFVALNLKTGRIAWATRTLPADMSTNFDHDDGPDYDFGSGPNLFTTTIGGRKRTLLGAGQKSGVYWALEPKTGKVVWQTQVGPGSLLGGMLWGTAADGKRIYVSIGNLNHESIAVTGPQGTTTTTGGIWAAVDASTGKVLWRTADPQQAMDTVAMTEANGVVYAGSLAGTGANMYALDAATGEIKWKFESGGAVVSGAAVVDGSVYWGSGYHTKVLGLPYAGDNKKLYAFAIPKQ